MRSGCDRPGCLTHPVLCEGRKCPDWERKEFIVSKPSYLHGERTRMGNRDSASEHGRAQKAKENEGRRRLDLGRICDQVCRNRRRIEENCPPKADTFDRQRLDAI